jgi:hypothetical protein
MSLKVVRGSTQVRFLVLLLAVVSMVCHYIEIVNSTGDETCRDTASQFLLQFYSLHGRNAYKWDRILRGAMSLSADDR